MDDRTGLRLDWLSQSESLTEALKIQEDRIRRQARDTDLRLMHLDLLCLLGQWERALTQLDVLIRLDQSQEAEATVYRLLIRAELDRRRLFARPEHPPLAVAPSSPWFADLWAAFQAQAAGLTDEADEARHRALALISARPGRALLKAEGAGVDFDWIIDSDSRLGPLTELIIDGQYAWLPFDEIDKIGFRPIRHPRDLIWPQVDLDRPAGPLHTFLLARYPGSEELEDVLRLGRETRWRDEGQTATIGFGQRVWASSGRDLAVYDLAGLDFAGAAHGPIQ